MIAPQIARAVRAQTEGGAERELIGRERAVVEGGAEAADHEQPVDFSLRLQKRLPVAFNCGRSTLERRWPEAG